MCRYVSYLGEPLVLADLVYRPANSLIHQAAEAMEKAATQPGGGGMAGMGMGAGMGFGMAQQMAQAMAQGQQQAAGGQVLEFDVFYLHPHGRSAVHLKGDDSLHQSSFLIMIDNPTSTPRVGSSSMRILGVMASHLPRTTFC